MGRDDVRPLAQNIRLRGKRIASKGKLTHFQNPNKSICVGKAVVTEKWYNVGVSDMCMMDEIHAKRDAIHAVANKHKADKLWVFGSYARREVVA